MKLNREIRKAFIPRDEEHILLAADYSQIELRLIAEIANEQEMLRDFGYIKQYARTKYIDYIIATGTFINIVIMIVISNDNNIVFSHFVKKVLKIRKSI